VYGGGEIVDPNATVTVDAVLCVYNGNWSKIGTDEYAALSDEEKTALKQANAADDMVATYNVKKFTLTNYPNSKLEDVCFYPNPLDCDEAKCELQIKGATSKTQIIIFGGGYDAEHKGATASTYTITGKSGKEYSGKYCPNINRLFIDNFKVYAPDASGIENAIVDENAPAEYINLQGVRVANPAKGIYVKRQGNKATKVLVK
jgi:hypothetical protein